MTSLILHYITIFNKYCNVTVQSRNQLTWHNTQYSHILYQTMRRNEEELVQAEGWSNWERTSVTFVVKKGNKKNQTKSSDLRHFVLIKCSGKSVTFPHWFRDKRIATNSKGVSRLLPWVISCLAIDWSSLTTINAYLCSAFPCFGFLCQHKITHWVF